MAYQQVRRRVEIWVRSDRIAPVDPICPTPGPQACRPWPGERSAPGWRERALLDPFQLDRHTVNGHLERTEESGLDQGSHARMVPTQAASTVTGRLVDRRSAASAAMSTICVHAPSAETR